MAIDFASSNSTRYLSTPTSDNLVMRNVDWTWLWCGRINTAISYLISSGVSGATNSFNLYANSSADGFTLRTSDIWNVWGGGTVTLNTSYLVWVTKRSGVIYLGATELANPSNGNENAGNTVATVYTLNNPVDFCRNTNGGSYLNGRLFFSLYSPYVGITSDECERIANGRVALNNTEVFRRRSFYLKAESSAHSQFTDKTGRHIITVNGSGYGSNESTPEELITSISRTKKIFLPLFAGAGGGGVTVQINQTTETDLSQTFVGFKTASINQTTETDLSQTFVGEKVYSINIVAETDFSQTFGSGIFGQINIIIESDETNNFNGLKTSSFGLASETDTSGQFIFGQTIPINLASETDQALLQSIVKNIIQQINLAIESNTSNGMTVIMPIDVSISIASETDVAQALSIILGEIEPLPAGVTLTFKLYDPELTLKLYKPEVTFKI